MSITQKNYLEVWLEGATSYVSRHRSEREAIESAQRRGPGRHEIRINGGLFLEVVNSPTQSPVFMYSEVDDIATASLLGGATVQVPTFYVWYFGSSSVVFTVDTLPVAEFEPIPVAHLTLANGPHVFSNGTHEVNFVVDATVGSVGAGQLGFTASGYSTSAGTGTTVFVSRTGGAVGAISVDYALTGTSGDVSGTLSWTDGETANQSFAIPAFTPGSTENGTLALSNYATSGILALPTAGTNTSVNYEVVVGGTVTTYPGIPDPSSEFGYDPTTITRPSDPAEWPSAANGAFYYVDNSDGNATDTANSNGYPDQPRLTWPSSMNAGDTMVVAGGSGYDPSSQSGNRPGTQADKIFLVWEGAGQYGELSDTLAFNTGDSHVIADGWYWDETAGIETAVSVNGSGTGYICVRNCRHDGDNTGTSNGTSMTSAGSSDSNYIHDIVFHNNTIVNIRDKSGVSQVDFIGFVPRHNATRIWYLANTATDLGGDSLRTGSNVSRLDPGEDKPTHIYVGGNDFGDNGENPIDLKNSQHVIISKNNIRDAGLSTSSSGVGIVSHEACKDVWMIGNYFTNLLRGFQGTTDGDGSGDGPIERHYLVANVFDNIETGSGSSSNGSCIIWRPGPEECSVVDNTFYDYKRGVDIRAGSIAPEVSGNLFTNRRNESGEYDVNQGGTINTFDSNLFDDKLLSGSTITETNTVEGGPELVDPANGDFTLQAISPAVDANDKHAVYALFAATYPGQSIDFDRSGNARPAVDSDRDIGAHER